MHSESMEEKSNNVPWAFKPVEGGKKFLVFLVSAILFFSLIVFIFSVYAILWTSYEIDMSRHIQMFPFAKVMFFYLVLIYLCTTGFLYFYRKFRFSIYDRNISNGNICCISSNFLRIISGPGRLKLDKEGVFLKCNVGPSLIPPLIASIVLLFILGPQGVVYLTLSFLIYHFMLRKPRELVIKWDSIASVRCKGPIVRLKLRDSLMLHLKVIKFFVPAAIRTEFFCQLHRINPSLLPDDYCAVIDNLKCDNEDIEEADILLSGYVTDIPPQEPNTAVHIFMIIAAILFWLPLSSIIFGLSTLFLIVTSVYLLFESRKLYLQRNLIVIGCCFCSLVASIGIPQSMEVNRRIKAEHKSELFNSIIKEAKTLATLSDFKKAYDSKKRLDSGFKIRIPKKSLLVLEGRGDYNALELGVHRWEGYLDTELLAIDPTTVKYIAIVGPIATEPTTQERKFGTMDVSKRTGETSMIAPVIVYSWPDKSFVKSAQVNDVVKRVPSYPDFGLEKQLAMQINDAFKVEQ